MKTKKKLIISVSALVAVVAIMVVAIVAILAVPNADVEQAFTVKYTATDVSATIRANTVVGSTRTALQTESGDEEIVFRPTDEEQTKTFTISEINLDTKSHSTVFEYIFTNDSNSVDVAVCMLREFSKENMSVRYSFSYEQIEDVSDLSLTTTFAPMMVLGEEKESGAYHTLYMYVKATVVNLANNANLNGGLTFYLTKDEPVKLNFENTTTATNASLFGTWIVPKTFADGTGDSSDHAYTFGLPQPIFSSGNYTWYTDSALTTKLDYPFMFDEDTTIYAGTTDYTIECIADFAYIDDEVCYCESEALLIENTSSDKLYVKSDCVKQFYYSKNFVIDYDVTNGDTIDVITPTVHRLFANEYLIIAPGEKVEIRYDFQTVWTNIDDNGKKIFEQFGVTKTQPADISTKLFYASYGAYPQVYVGDDLNNTLRSSTTTLTPTGKSYTVDMGSSWTNDESIVLNVNGNKSGIHTATLVEYTYNGMTVAKLDSAKTIYDFAGSAAGDYLIYEFNNGLVSAKDGGTYFFFVEPILTKAMQYNASGTYTVQTCDVIGSRAFTLCGPEEQAGTWDNSWENSDIRAYLNTIFLSESGLADLVVETTISNPDHYNTSPCDGDTTDKIWLASLDEIVTWLGKGDQLEKIIEDGQMMVDELDNDIIFPQISDMALASYGYKKKYVIDGDTFNSSFFWLRSPGYYDYIVGIVVEGGVRAYGGEYYIAFVGFCPAFNINL